MSTACPQRPGPIPPDSIEQSHTNTTTNTSTLKNQALPQNSQQPPLTNPTPSLPPSSPARPALSAHDALALDGLEAAVEVALHLVRLVARGRCVAQGPPTQQQNQQQPPMQPGSSGPTPKPSGMPCPKATMTGPVVLPMKDAPNTWCFSGRPVWAAAQ